jgi:hypothetical protein
VLFLIPLQFVEHESVSTQEKLPVPYSFRQVPKTYVQSCWAFFTKQKNTRLVWTSCPSVRPSICLWRRYLHPKRQTRSCLFWVGGGGGGGSSAFSTFTKSHMETPTVRLVPSYYAQRT